MSGAQLTFLDDEYSLAARRAWERALPMLAGKVSKVTFESYIRPLKPLCLRDREIVLGVSSAFAREWIDKRYLGMIRTVLETVLGCAIDVRVKVLASAERAAFGMPGSETFPAPDPEPPAKATTGGRKARAGALSPSALAAMDAEMSQPLNAKFTFASFVTGANNRLAYTAALSVAEAPGHSYNPLFIYGPSGLGKTHLLHSIGHQLRSEDEALRVVVVDGESFTHHYVASLREKKSDEFRKYFRSVDVWLIDDIQFIAGKEHTKEEFFHTFNALHQTGRQIVLTSDKSPRELHLMDDRLRTRFEAGLIADVAPPPIETRVAIIENRCRSEGWTVPEDVLFFIADAIQSNVRALEGAVTRLVVNSSVLNVPMDIELAQSVLTHFFIDKKAPATKLRVPLDAVLELVSDAFGTNVDAVRSQRRDQRTALARQVAMYLCRELCDLPCREIGALLGGRDHTTVQRAVQKIETTMPQDAKLRGTVLELRARLTR